MTVSPDKCQPVSSSSQSPPWLFTIPTSVVVVGGEKRRQREEEMNGPELFALQLIKNIPCPSPRLQDMHVAAAVTFLSQVLCVSSFRLEEGELCRSRIEITFVLNVMFQFNLLSAWTCRLVRSVCLDGRLFVAQLFFTFATVRRHGAVFAWLGPDRISATHETFPLTKQEEPRTVYSLDYNYVAQVADAHRRVPSTLVPC